MIRMDTKYHMVKDTLSLAAMAYTAYCALRGWWDLTRDATKALNDQIDKFEKK